MVLGGQQVNYTHAYIHKYREGCQSVNSAYHVRHEQASHDSQGGGLAGPRTAYDAHRLPTPDFDVGTSKYGLVAKGLVHILQLNEDVAKLRFRLREADHASLCALVGV